MVELEALINQLDNPSNAGDLSEKGGFLTGDNLSFKGQEFDACGEDDGALSGDEKTLSLSLRTAKPSLVSHVRSNQKKARPKYQQSEKQLPSARQPLEIVEQTKPRYEMSRRQKKEKIREIR